MKVAIDTNIFIHLFNPGNNPDSHIDQLLIHLAKSGPQLCVDTTEKIANEYLEKLGPMVKQENEIGIQLYILRFWMETGIRCSIETDPTDLLMHRIRQAIPEADEHADRAFVYVSCKGNCCLVTNDGEHILPRRTIIKSKTKKLRGKDSVIYDSQEAIPYFIAPSTAAA
jgi:hypothetical protein